MEPLFQLKETDYWNKFVTAEPVRTAPSPAAAPPSRSLRSADVIYVVPSNCYWNALRTDEAETSIKAWSTPVGSFKPERLEAQSLNCEQSIVIDDANWSDGSSLVWESFLAVEEGPSLDIDDLVNEISAACEEEKVGCAEDDHVDQDVLDDFSLSDLTDTILNFLSADQKEQFGERIEDASVPTANDYDPTK